MKKKLSMMVAVVAAYPPRESSAEGISPERSENCEAISLEVCSMRGAFGAWAATETVGGYCETFGIMLTIDGNNVVTDVTVQF